MQDQKLKYPEKDENEELTDLDDPLNRGLFEPEFRDFTSNMFCRGESFRQGMEFWMESSNCRKCADWLYERTRATKTLPCTYRTLNHWEDHGLIECGRDSEKGWRKFSFIEEVWIHFIGELRKFGFPIDKILKCKHLFFEKHSEEYPIPLMEYYIGSAFGWSEPIFLLVFDDGGGTPFSYRELQSATNLYAVPDHIRININKILEKTGVSYYTPPKFPIEAQLRHEEAEVFLQVRMGEYQSITIYNKNGSISRIESTKDCDADTKIGDLLHAHDYQEIQLQKQNGKIVSIKQTVSMKPKNGGTPLIT